MAVTNTYSGTTFSATISPLVSNTTYYYQITAFNNTTPGPTSTVQSNPTAGGGTGGQSNSLVLIGGKLYAETINSKLQLAIKGVNITTSPLTPSANGTVISAPGQTIIDSNLNTITLK